VLVLPAQVVQQPAVGQVAGGPGHQPVHRSLQPRHLGGELAGVQGAGGSAGIPGRRGQAPAPPHQG
jgi:hypothetical protein